MPSMVDLSGKFALNDLGYSIGLKGVPKMKSRDLSPLVFESLISDGQVLRADPPLHLKPELDDETQQLYVAKDDSLDLHAFATTREDLADEITRHIFCAWETYVGEMPDRMTQAAQRLQQAYSRRFRLVSPLDRDRFDEILDRQNLLS